MSKEKLGSFLREVSNWEWDRFVKAEKDLGYTSNQSIIFALVRACSWRKMDAIKMALNRIDGKLVTPVKLEMPKVFYTYPNAKRFENGTEILALNPGFAKVTDDPTTVNEVETIMEGELIPAPDIPEINYPTPEEIESMGLRETLDAMSELPRELPESIIAFAEQTEQWINNRADHPDEIPKVKSVIAANLLIMAQERNITALTEVFDQIDGKLVETIKVLGEDIYLQIYSETAPDNALPNEDGVLQVEAPQAQMDWAKKLGEEIK